MNSVKHGLRAEGNLIDGEDPQEFQELRESMWDSLKPVGGLEEELTRRVVSCAWRLRRIEAMEVEAFDELARQAHIKSCEEAQAMLDLETFGYSKVRRGLFDPPKPASKERNQAIFTRRDLLVENMGHSYGKGLVCDRATQTFNLLRRYETSIDKAMASALARLESLQATRKREAAALGSEALPHSASKREAAASGVEVAVGTRSSGKKVTRSRKKTEEDAAKAVVAYRDSGENESAPATLGSDPQTLDPNPQTPDETPNPKPQTPDQTPDPKPQTPYRTLADLPTPVVFLGPDGENRYDFNLTPEEMKALPQSLRKDLADLALMLGGELPAANR